MSGDEGSLRYDLLDAVRGSTPRSDTWRRAQGADSYFSGAGSQNIWLMRFATQALRGQTVPWEAVYHYQLGPPPGTVLAARGGDLLVTPEPSSADRVYAPGFGGSEFMSSIYWPWHLLSHVALVRKGSAIGSLARRWVALNWALSRAIQASDGSLLLFGQRSAGHNPKPREADWLFALASGGDTTRAEEWCRRAGAGLRRSWEFEMGNELLPEMRETWQESLLIKETDLPGLFPLRVPTEIIRTTEGVAVVHASNCNPNTPPILAGAFAGGRLDVLPANGGRRIRQKFDHAIARIDGREIVYASSLYTGGEEVRLPLPGGEVVYHLRLGTGGAGRAEKPLRGGDPTDTPPPSPPGDLNRAADLLAGLQLAAKDRGRRDAIVAALRAGDDPEPYLPVIRAWFRPDSPQLQAVQWREALEILARVG